MRRWDDELDKLVLSHSLYIYSLGFNRRNHPVEQFDIGLAGVDVHNFVNLRSRSGPGKGQVQWEVQVPALNTGFLTNFLDSLAVIQVVTTVDQFILQAVQYG